jgi:hypothetical protein
VRSEPSEGDGKQGSPEGGEEGEPTGGGKEGEPPEPPETPVIFIDPERSPESAQHIEDAQQEGQPTGGVIDREGADERRRESLEGVPSPPPGYDRDEYPPAVLDTGGAGSDVREVPSGDNRSAGGQLGRRIKELPDGTSIEITTEPP